MATEAKFERMTPTKARRLLAKNDRNFRHLSEMRVGKYASMMERGQWDEHSYEPVRVDPDGHLIDGQHRLAAIARSGVTLRVLVLYGITSDIGLDMGTRRSRGDLVRKYCDVDNARLVATLATELIDSMRVGYDLAHRGGGSYYQNAATDQEVIQIINEHPEAFAIAAKAKGGGNNGKIYTTNSQFTFIRLLGIPDYDEQAEAFCRQIKTGENLTKGSPALALRDAMTRELARSSYSGGSVSRWVRAALYGIAWEKFITRRRANRIKPPERARLADPPGLEEWRVLTGIQYERTDKEEADDDHDRPNATKSDSAAASGGARRAGAVDRRGGRARTDRDLEGPRANP